MEHASALEQDRQLAGPDPHGVLDAVVLARVHGDGRGGERRRLLHERLDVGLLGRDLRLDQDVDRLLVLEVRDLDLVLLVLPLGGLLAGADLRRGAAVVGHGGAAHQDALRLDVRRGAEADLELLVLGDFLHLGAGGELDLRLRVALEHLDVAGRQRGAEVVLGAVAKLETRADRGQTAVAVGVEPDRDVVLVLDGHVLAAEERDLTRLAIAQAHPTRDAVDLPLADRLDRRAIEAGGRGGQVGRLAPQAAPDVALLHAARQHPQVGVVERGAALVDDVDGALEGLDLLGRLVVQQRVLRRPAHAVGLVEEVQGVVAGGRGLGLDHERSGRGQPLGQLGQLDVLAAAEVDLTGGVLDDELPVTHAHQLAGDLLRGGAAAERGGDLLADGHLEQAVDVGRLVGRGLVLELARALDVEQPEAVVAVLRGDPIELDADLARLELDLAVLLDLGEALAVDGEVDGLGGLGDGERGLRGIVGPCGRERAGQGQGGQNRDAEQTEPLHVVLHGFLFPLLVLGCCPKSARRTDWRCQAAP